MSSKLFSADNISVSITQLGCPVLPCSAFSLLFFPSSSTAFSTAPLKNVKKNSLLGILGSTSHAVKYLVCPFSHLCSCGCCISLGFSMTRPFHCQCLQLFYPTFQETLILDILQFKNPCCSAD